MESYCNDPYIRPREEVTYVPVRELTREEVEEMAEEGGLASFARQALLEADFMDCKVRFLLIGDNQLALQKVKE